MVRARFAILQPNKEMEGRVQEMEGFLVLSTGRPLGPGGNSRCTGFKLPSKS